MAEEYDAGEEYNRKATEATSQDDAAFNSYSGIMSPDAPPADDAPIYRVIGESKIPVSKHRGPLWRSRYDQGRSAMSKNVDAWNEAYRYYRHDHTRQGAGSKQGEDNTVGGKSLAGNFDSTENIVFANVSALVPLLFTKNPDAEFTCEDKEDQERARIVEKLVNVLAAKKTTPGLNLKRKVKRNIVSTSLTNLGWFEVGYTLREQSSEAALEEIQRLSAELEQAKSQKDIKECEGKLLALEETIDMLTPSGPWCKVRRPDQIIVDPTATDLDLSGPCNWVMIEDLMYTALLRARYGRKKPGTDEWESVFSPTNVIKAGVSPDQGDRGQTDNFQLFSYSTSEHTKYGYADQRSFLAAQMTKVVYVWDKVTRRVELYNCNDWCYPLWVWDDPYSLDQFFSVVPMEFHTDPITMYAKGEVTYYLDQQDDINIINNEWAKVRKFAAGKVVYDKNSLKDASVLDALIAGTTDTNTVGVDLPEGKKLSDALGPLLPPSADAIKFFDKKPVLEAIDRLSGVASVQRGVEYKTNTTNKAIESYESQIQTRADEKMDAIEDSVGTVLWLTAQMCLQFMSKQEVVSLIGEELGSKWETVDAKVIQQLFTPRVVGGSTLKPTSRAKKEQALQISQIIGQFTRATPIAAVVALKVLSQAFDNVTVSQEDWELIYKGIMKEASGPPPEQMQQEQQDQQAEQQGADRNQQMMIEKMKAAGGGAPQGGGGAQGGGDSGTQIDDIASIVQEVARLIDGLPQDMKRNLGVQLAQGRSVADIAMQMIGSMQQGAAA
jgi:hypothetical protein